MSNQSKMNGFFKRLAEDSILEGEQQTRHISNDLDEDVLLDVSPGPLTVADKPDIWTNEMWFEKQQQYPWLSCKNAKLGCNFCASARGLGPNRMQGVYLSPEWQTTNVTYNGHSHEANLASLRKKIFKHLHSDAHIKAKDIVAHQKKNSMPPHVEVMNSIYLDTTKRIFRTSYYIAKNDRPLSDHQGLVDLQIQNGVDMGTGLRSRFSATAIIDHIANEMRSTICKTIKENNGKVSILIVESTTGSDILTLIIYLNAQLETSGEPQFLFLDLVELRNGESAERSTRH